MTMATAVWVMLGLSMMNRLSLAISVAAPSTSTRKSTSHCMASTLLTADPGDDDLRNADGDRNARREDEIFGQRVEREKNDRGQKIQKQLAQRGPA